MRDDERQRGDERTRVGVRPDRDRRERGTKRQRREEGVREGTRRSKIELVNESLSNLLRVN